MKNALLQVLIFFWRGIVLLPRKFQIYLSNIFGYVLFYSNNKRNRFSRINIDLCFSDLSKERRFEIYKKNIILFGRVIFDTGIAWFWSDKRINKNISYKINGLELLLRYQKLNKRDSTIFLNTHFHL
jgi:Lauroyl/myristoyl acyltransferase